MEETLANSNLIQTIKVTKFILFMVTRPKRITIHDLVVLSSSVDL